MTARPQLRPMVGTSHGRPAAGDLRGLAAILLRMDKRPLRVVAAPANQRSICQPHKT